jgi:dynamin 1-like protein
MEQLIPIVNKLQDVFNTVGSQLIDLPQIAVVGSQSSGKSSVLESFVGRDFLPRGSGIVTRRPLVLQLIHLDDPRAKERAEFLHKPGVEYTDFSQISAEISAETDRGTGGGRNISPIPINLKLWSPNVLNLTVVDLPGLVKNAVEGQDPRIVDQIHTMVRGFVGQRSSLILAVTPANDDIANSDSLRLAREVDPMGDRTIGVITKVDLMDSGTDCRAVLQNRIYPLKLGYIGVVNRSQSEIDRRLPVEQARKKEREFFDGSRDYSDIADRCGSTYLVSLLNQQLMEHIRTCMPALRQRIQSMLAEKEEELHGYGENPSVSRGTMNAFVLDTITKYLDNYNALLEGRAQDACADLAQLKTNGGSRISRVFMDVFNPRIDRLEGLTKLSDSNMFFLMKNHEGLKVPLFTPHEAFDTILFRAIEQLRVPALELVDQVVSILFEIHGEVEFMEMQRFTGLGESMRAAVDDCIRTCVDPTKEFINGLIDNETSFINASRQDFKGPPLISAPRTEDPRARPLPERPAVPDPVGVCFIYGTAKDLKSDLNNLKEMKDLRQIGSRYFDLIKEQIRDLVPKAVAKFLVAGSTKLLRPKMVETIFNAADVAELLQEDSAITRKRIACQQIVDALRKGREILNEVNTFNAK